MRADTKEKIIRASLRLFVRQGIAATTTKDIAEAARIAEGTIYRHFASKEAMAEEIFVTNYLPFGAALRSAGADGKTIAEKIRAMVAHFYDSFERDPDLFAYLVIAQHTAVDKLPPGAPTPVRILNEVLRQVKPKRLDPKLLTHIVLGMILQPASARLKGDVLKPLNSYTDAVVGAILDVVQ
jgi:AcrR family transcriptional regulator